MDDALVLPVLRNLSCVKRVDWPPKVWAYMKAACVKAGIPTYEDHAC